MNVLSLFDGMSCGQIALNKLGIVVDNYFASEIKENAIKVTEYNYPNTIQLGDVKSLTDEKLESLPKIDLLIGGSPCQDLSPAMKKRKGLKGSKSQLFWEYIRVLNKIKPKYFLLENVARMKNEDKEVINETLGVKPIRINSKLVSAQLRDRLYWTNLPNVSLPKDRGIKLEHVLENGFTDREKSRALLASDSRPLKSKEKMWHRYKNTGFTTIVFENGIEDTHNIRYLNQVELERLQTVPYGYTKILNRNQAADLLGDGWTVDVIAHLFKGLKEEYIMKEVNLDSAQNIELDELYIEQITV
ncbi:DNA (cytosine-5-)-methyltransferase [Bacillus subtilis]|uniref:DNA (cytosine-5-)-methyltransferase n=1 Tax=Bacillus subtilis TaxID=1423 RepID=UPI0027DFC8C4|nr:DNA (cytosine-5-)-methyltransferase [Bacillus subtilis]MDQ4712002.1 DNA (cytosine-5-)-methyltransferase [Bacillus subtilis]